MDAPFLECEKHSSKVSSVLMDIFCDQQSMCFFIIFFRHSISFLIFFATIT